MKYMMQGHYSLVVSINSIDSVKLFYLMLESSRAFGIEAKRSLHSFYRRGVRSQGSQ